MSIQQFPSSSDDRFNPIETLIDPVNKLRTSQPQALIDTDFEYGTQITKWENLAVTNNRPFAYFSPTPFTNISGISMPTNSRTITVSLATQAATVTGASGGNPVSNYVTYTTSAAHGFSVEQYVVVSGASQSNYNGLFFITSIPAANQFTVINAATGSVTFTNGAATAGVAPPTGTALTIQDTFLSEANGIYLIETGGGTGTFTYLGRSQNRTNVTSILDTNKTAIYSATLYTGARIGSNPIINNDINSYSGYAISVTTSVPHGLSIGNTIAISGLTGTNPPNGAYRVATVDSATSFTYFAEPSEGVPASLDPTNASVFVRPQATYSHRPFDGGVVFSTNASSNYEAAIRQTRRYFRYQSGKGLQVSSGTTIKPYLNVDTITSSGTTATVLTKDAHGILPGAQVQIAGANQAAYNGTFTVDQVTGLNSFTYGLPSSAASPATGIIDLNVASWFGSANRLGQFDSQNGIFWEFDGQGLYAVRRSSTQQISGRSNVTFGSNTVTRTSASFPTSYSSQLRPGDYVVIRGQSYRVIAIDDLSATPNFTISPSYRGISASHVTISKTEELRVPQADFNLDTLDGNGPSGYNIDLTKMQMWYIDYSWYGAGFIRWGVRGPDGDVIYAHKMKNNNVNTEAYMRSGNLPARYETSTLPPTTLLGASLADNAQTMTVASTAGFPSSGTLVIIPSTTNNQASLLREYVNYNGKTATTFTGLTRGKMGAALTTTWTVGSNTGTVSSNTNLQIGMRAIASSPANAVPDGAFITSINGSSVTLNLPVTSANPTIMFPAMGATGAQAYTYSASSPTSVELAYPTYAPSISHWGTSVIMDGRFDDDASLIFTYGQTGQVSIAANQSRAIFAIRLAPSVDNGIAANFGQRELINRGQLKLLNLGVTTANPGTNYLVRAYLNAVPSIGTTWRAPNFFETGTDNSSFAQIADYRASGAVTISGGEIVGGFLSAGTDSIDLTKLRDLGNCILGGGGSSSETGIYPDGPDTLTIVVTNLSSSTAAFSGRVSWTEAQA